MTSTEQQIEQFIGTLVSFGCSAGNQRLLETLGWQDSIYQRIKQQLIDDGRIRPGRGRGGSVALVENVSSLPKPVTEPSAAIKRQANETRKEDRHDAIRDKDMRPIEQQFFNDLEKKLWTAADKLRSNLDTAVYKHVVLGLIFLKYVSDAFEERQRELREQFTNPDHDYYMDPDEYGGAGIQEYEDSIAAELEVRDYYTEKNVFWVPVEARWQTLRDCAQLPPKAALPWSKPGKNKPEEMRSVGWLIDNTMEAMAQAIFKSWFVDFNPVKAKIAAIEQGQDPLRAAMRAISGKTDAELDQMPREHHDKLAATAALFPDAMEESELGDIPKGWEAKRVGDLIELAYGKALKSNGRKQGSVPVYGSGGVTGYHNEALVPHGAIIVGRKATVGSLYWEDKPFFPIDTTFYVKPKAMPMTYCFYVMQMLGLDKMNTDAAVPDLNRENVYRLELVKPSESGLNDFDELVGRIRQAMRENETESRSLAELRDTLPPKLLSGEIAVDSLAEENM